LAEDIRMDGAKSALNNYIDADVDRFNAMVADYNSRCSSFKYQTNNRGRNDLNSVNETLSHSGVSFNPKAGADLLVRPLARCRHQRRRVLHRMRRCKPSSASSTNLGTKLEPLTVDGTRHSFSNHRFPAGGDGVADQALLLQLQHSSRTNDPGRRDHRQLHHCATAGVAKANRISKVVAAGSTTAMGLRM
jgi:hypothetical protein